MYDAILIVGVTDDEDPALCGSTRSKESVFALHWAFCPSWVSVFFLQNESFDQIIAMMLFRIMNPYMPQNLSFVINLLSSFPNMERPCHLYLFITYIQISAKRMDCETGRPKFKSLIYCLLLVSSCQLLMHSVPQFVRL